MNDEDYVAELRQKQRELVVAQEALRDIRDAKRDYEGELLEAERAVNTLTTATNMLLNRFRRHLAEFDADGEAPEPTPPARGEVRRGERRG